MTNLARPFVRVSKRSAAPLFFEEEGIKEVRLINKFTGFDLEWPLSPPGQHLLVNWL